MNQKKKASNLIIAIVHAFISNLVFIAIETSIAVILINLLEGLFPSIPLSSLIYIVIAFEVVLILLIGWFGPLVGAQFIARKFIVTDKARITKYATLIILIIGGGYRLYGVFIMGDIFYQDFAYLISIFLFYFSSKKFLKNNPTNPSLQDSQQMPPPVDTMH
jgi:hypothetical protein